MRFFACTKTTKSKPVKQETIRTVFPYGVFSQAEQTKRYFNGTYHRAYPVFDPHRRNKLKTEIEETNRAKDLSLR